MARILPSASKLRTAVLTLTAGLVGTAAIVPSMFQPNRAHADDFIRNSIPQKWIDPLLPEDLPPLKYPAYFEDLDKAKAQVRAGRYKSALLSLKKMGEPKPEQRFLVAVIKGKALAAVGRVDEALKTLSDTTKVKATDLPDKPEIAIGEHPRVVLQRAEILADAGRPTEALALLAEHLKAHPDSWGGHFLTGQISEQIGDTETAKTHYGWFIDEPRNFLGKWTASVKIPEFDDAEKVTWMGRAADRWATLNLKYRDNSALPKQIMGIFAKAQTIDVDYYPSHIAAAEYFLEHDDRDKAGEELKEVLKINPQDITALDRMGQIALATFNFDQCDAIVEAIRKFNPNSHVADLMEARNLLHQRRPKDAEDPIQRVLTKQPRNIEAMGLLASVYALQLEEKKADEILKQVDAIDVGHDNASAYLDVAEQLSAMRQYPRAAAKYKVAIERAPWWAAARNGLGLLYTQSGDEDDARLVLEEARKFDPFNIATTNYLRLLDDMVRFKKIETEHFVVVFDPEKDPIIGEYFPQYLESIHADVSKHFKKEPPVKTFIEVFPSHDAFSVRTAGTPWIGTVGASTGRVIAMVSPRKGGSNMEPFNWAQVLRHEYTHTVTLAATDNRIQHWFTEGLAVYEEQSPVRWEWVPMLYQAVKKKELFTMENLTWGFVRPKRPIDRQLAYAQSWWICQYVEETYGHDAILKMLDMFRNAQRQEDVFPAVTGKPMSSFYADFLVWCEKKVDTWGYDKETSKKYDKLKDEAEQAKDAKQYDKAIEKWEEIVKIRPVDAMPHTRLAGLYLVTKKYDKAIKALDTLHQVELKDNRYAKQIARIYKTQEKWQDAEKYALQAIYISPYDISAHELMKEICEKSGNAKGQEREERVLPLLEKWEAQLKEKNQLRPSKPDGSK